MGDAQHPEYVLGHAPSELDRLIRQAAFYGDLTAHTLKLAGLGPGMRVLDVGCGAGDVSLLAASIVGPSGSVTGVDMNADRWSSRGARIEGAQIANMTIEAGDITKLPYTGEFDAVIGRLIVLYLGDQVAGMKAFCSYVKPGGLVYFQEFCQPGRASIPDGALVRSGPGVDRRDLRAREHRALHGHAAGRPVSRRRPSRAVNAGHVAGRNRTDSPAYEYMAQLVRTLLPLIERTGVATNDRSTSTRSRPGCASRPCRRTRSFTCPSSSPPGRACRANL